MNVIRTRKFEKDVAEISRNKKLLARLEELIILCEKATQLNDLPNLKAMKANSPAYRIRIGDYRMGFLYDGNDIILMRFFPRSEIYRHFP